MRITIVGVVLGLVSSVALAQREGSFRGPERPERAKAKVGRAVRDVPPAGLTVDFAYEDILVVTATDRDGNTMTLDFEPNETSDVLRPVLAGSIEQELFGMDPEAFLTSLTVEDPDISQGLLDSFHENTASIPHDDVTVFVISEELVFLFLWERGELIGTFYAVDTDAAAERFADENDSGSGGVAAPAIDFPTSRIVCQGVRGCCRSTCQDLYWIIACKMRVLCGDH